VKALNKYHSMYVLPLTRENMFPISASYRGRFFGIDESVIRPETFETYSQPWIRESETNRQIQVSWWAQGHVSFREYVRQHHATDINSRGRGYLKVSGESKWKKTGCNPHKGSCLPDFVTVIAYEDDVSYADAAPSRRVLISWVAWIWDMFALSLSLGSTRG
jgi:hypothetical protein